MVSLIMAVFTLSSSDLSRDMDGDTLTSISHGVRYDGVLVLRAHDHSKYEQAHEEKQVPEPRRSTKRHIDNSAAARTRHARSALAQIQRDARNDSSHCHLQLILL